MSQALTLFLAPGQEHSWHHPVSGFGQGTMAQVPAPGRLPVRVVVPGASVFVAAVSLPGRQLSRKLQALPYALEEQLVQDVDQYHFVLGGALAGGRQLAAAVERKVIDHWLGLLQGHNLEPDCLVPATLALPAPAGSGQAIVAIVADQALVRIGDDRAYQTAVADLDTLLQLEQGLTEVLVADPDGVWGNEAGLPCSPLDSTLSVLGLLTENVEGAPLNLLQGRYQGRGEAGSRVAYLWRRTATLALVVLALMVAERFLAYRSSAAAVAQLEEAVTGVVRNALGELPAGYRPLQARGLLEARLQALRGSTGAMDGLLFLLEAVGPRLAAGAGVQIESLNYRSDGLILELRADDLAAIEQLRQSIGQDTGVAVELESAATLADGTGARLRIGGAGG